MSAGRRTSAVVELEGFERSSRPRRGGTAGVAAADPSRPRARETALLDRRAAAARAERVIAPLAASLVSPPAEDYAALARLDSARSSPTTNRAHFLETR